MSNLDQDDSADEKYQIVNNMTVLHMSNFEQDDSAGDNGHIVTKMT